jgi:glutamine amidotransferase
MIAIIDYGTGNLKNVINALDYLGIPSEITSDPKQLAQAEKMILPGVGAFVPAMEQLTKSGLAEIIKERISNGIPLLGICLGMQLLFYESEEDGLTRGLNIIKGRVIRFTGSLKIPQIGWNSLEFVKQPLICQGIQNNSYVYFVHSYYCIPDDEDSITAWSDYGGRFAAIVEKNSIIGLQFHPEKSQQVGLVMLKNFYELY